MISCMKQKAMEMHDTSPHCIYFMESIFYCGFYGKILRLVKRNAVSIVQNHGVLRSQRCLYLESSIVLCMGIHFE